MRPPVGGEIGEAPPVADEASRFRGSAPIGGYDSARESVGTTVGKRAPPLRKRNKNYGEAGRRGRRPLQSSIGEWCVGDDAHIVPLTALLVMCHCETSSQTGRGNPYPPSPRPPCLKRAADRGILFPHKLTENKFPPTSQVSLHQPSAGPPPFRQGRLTSVGDDAYIVPLTELHVRRMPPAGYFLSPATESTQRTPPKPMVLESLRGRGPVAVPKISALPYGCRLKF